VRLGARNVLRERVARVVRGGATGHVTLDIGGGVVVPVSVTMAAIRELGLKKGDRALAIVKAADVIVGKA
jgi:molybdopterin-binding protein